MTTVMDNNVQGEWNNFYFKRVEPSEYSRVIAWMIDNYIFETPLLKILVTSEDKMGINEELISDYVQYFATILPQNLSLLAIDQMSNQIACVRMTRNHTIKPDFCPSQFDSNEFKAVCAVKSHLEKEADIFKRFGIDHYADLTGCAVLKPYRRAGLYTEIINRSEMYYKSLGYKLTKTVCFGPESIAAAHRLGLTELSRAYYSELMDEDGFPYFPKFPHPEWYAPLMVETL